MGQNPAVETRAVACFVRVHTQTGGWNPASESIRLLCTSEGRWLEVGLMVIEDKKLKAPCQFLFTSLFYKNKLVRVKSQ